MNHSWIEKLSEEIIRNYDQWEREAIEVQDITWSEQNGPTRDGFNYLKMKLLQIIAKEWLEQETKYMLEQLNENRSEG